AWGGGPSGLPPGPPGDCGDAVMSKKGFTLIELMIVVVIIGILAAIAIPNFAALVGRAREASTKKNMHLLQTATEDFAAVSSGRYPDNLTDTSDDGQTLQ